MANELAVMSLNEITGYAKLFADSGMFADTRGMAMCAVKIQAGAEIGISPFASMNGLHIIQGKITMSAGMISMLIKRSGKYNYRVTEHTDETCSIKFTESGQECGISTFSVSDAKAAQIFSNPMWNKYRRNMLFSRAVSNGAKWYCADVFGGPVYTPDELDNNVQYTSEGDVITSSFQPEPTPTPASRPQNWRNNEDVKTATEAAVAKSAPGFQEPTPKPYERTDVISDAHAVKMKERCLLMGVDIPEMAGWTYEGATKFWKENLTEVVATPEPAEMYIPENPGKPASAEQKSAIRLLAINNKFKEPANIDSLTWDEAIDIIEGMREQVEARKAKR